MQREVEDVFSNLGTAVEVDLGQGQFVTEALGLRYDLAGGGDDAAAADEIAAFFAAGFGDADHPAAVLVGTGPHRQMIVEILQVVMFGCWWIVCRRVVTEENHLGTHLITDKVQAVQMTHSDQQVHIGNLDCSSFLLFHIRLLRLPLI